VHVAVYRTPASTGPEGAGGTQLTANGSTVVPLYAWVPVRGVGVELSVTVTVKL
jgi:hypothetical protein